MSISLLELRDVSLSIQRPREPAVPILRQVAMDIQRGEIVGMVGESGGGKSMATRVILRSLPLYAAVTGEVLLDGRDLLAMPRSQLRKVRARTIGAIFQDPRSGVDPMWTIEDHITEGLRVHGRLSRHQARDRAVELLGQVGILDGPRRLRQYPHELSGGMLQRVVIAGALAGDPELLIADEPTTGLDVTSQAEVVGIFARLRQERQLGMMFVTHDLALAAALCDRIVVMYAGRILEIGAGASILSSPAHPYTAALASARPSVEARKAELAVIPGQPVSAALAPSGCPFRTRCRFADDSCREAPMELSDYDGARTACIRPEVTVGGHV